MSDLRLSSAKSCTALCIARVRTALFLSSVGAIFAASACGSSTDAPSAPAKVPSTPTPPTPIPPKPASRWLQVAGGDSHTCALTTEGIAYCWGFSEWGQLGATAPTACSPVTGSGRFPCALSPLLVETEVRFAKIAVGAKFSCGLTAEGKAFCWGGNIYGNLGIGVIDSVHGVTAVATGLTFTTLTLGTSHTCGLSTSGAAYCWGRNDNGQLAVTPRGMVAAPAPVVGGEAFQAISAGYRNTCALTLTGEARCWGERWIADIDSVWSSLSTTLAPTATVDTMVFSDIAVAGHTTCGLRPNGDIRCWGYNHGNFGNGTDTGSLTPQLVQGTGYTALYRNYWQFCALRQGTAYCWGLTPTPELVSADYTFASLGVGVGNACGVTAVGEMYCWGSAYSQLPWSSPGQPWSKPVRVNVPTG